MSRSAAASASSNASDQQICCLVDKGKKCKRFAGNASYNRRIQKLVFKHNLGLQIDDSVNHLYICDHHKNLIQDKSKHKSEKPKHSSESKTNGRGQSSSSSSSQATSAPSTSSSSVPPAPSASSSSSRHSKSHEGHNRQSEKASQQQQHQSQPSSQSQTRQSTSAAARLRATESNAVDYDFMKMPISVLRRYKTHFKLPTEVGMTKVQIARLVTDHFSSWKVSEREVVAYFLYTLKAGKNRLDRKGDPERKA